MRTWKNVWHKIVETRTPVVQKFLIKIGGKSHSLARVFTEGLELQRLRSLRTSDLLRSTPVISRPKFIRPAPPAPSISWEQTTRWKLAASKEKQATYAMMFFALLSFQDLEYSNVSVNHFQTKSVCTSSVQQTWSMATGLNTWDPLVAVPPIDFGILDAWLGGPPTGPCCFFVSLENFDCEGAPPDLAERDFHRTAGWCSLKSAQNDFKYIISITINF